MTENKDKKIGKYKTKTKFIEFVGGKGHVNFISNEATVEAKYLSGLDLDGVILKLTICDDDTVDFDEVDTELTTESQRQRLLEVIEEKTVTSYRSRSVIQEIPFTSTQKVKDKFVPLYLAVEFEKPIDKLASILQANVEASQTALSNLDSLLESIFDDLLEEGLDEMFDDEIDEGGEYILKDDSVLQNMSNLESSFQKLKEDKLNELKKSKDSKVKEINKLRSQTEMFNNQIKTLEQDLQLVESRIDDLNIEPTPNGYFFSVSERINETITLDSETETKIKNVVSKVKSINTDNFMKLFTQGQFKIKIGKKDNNDLVTPITELDKNLFSNSDFIDSFPFDNISLENDEILLSTDLIWAVIVNKMVKSGFSQDPGFDELCGSNSYKSNTDQVTNTD